MATLLEEFTEFVAALNQRPLAYAVCEWEHGAISTVSREGLIHLKRLSGRLQDLADIERLESES